MTPEWLRLELAEVASYGVDAALVLSLLRYRTHGTGSWEATRETLMAETHLTRHRLDAAVTRLRDAGQVTATRADRFRPTLTWTICAGQPVMQESGITRISETASPVMQESGITSYQEVEEPLVGLPVPPGGAMAAAEAPAETTPTGRRRRPLTPLPEGFGPTEAHRRLAAELGVDLSEAGPRFVDYHTARDSRFRDWSAALNTWIRNQARFDAQRGDRSNVLRLRPADQVPGEAYDAQGAAQLPPPVTDPFVRGAL